MRRPGQAITWRQDDPHRVGWPGRTRLGPGGHGNRLP